MCGCVPHQAFLDVFGSYLYIVCVISVSRLVLISKLKIDDKGPKKNQNQDKHGNIIITK